jgi:uncharacterized membrane protein (UPF0127 family)
MKKITALVFTVLLVLPSAVVFAAEKQKLCFSKNVCVNAQVVRDKIALEQGMAFRKSLGKNEGMFYIFPSSNVGFQAKNMLFALDVIYLDEHKKVVFISPDMAPCAGDVCLVSRPSCQFTYMLEVNAGFAKAHGIKVGDRIRP